MAGGIYCFMEMEGRLSFGRGRGSLLGRCYSTRLRGFCLCRSSRFYMGLPRRVIAAYSAAGLLQGDATPIFAINNNVT
jgi:hypothetical protein